jgi:serine/threonine protein kinase
LRIAANQFTELPQCVYRLPRLAWLAYAGNPFCAEQENRALTESELTVIRWETLTVQQQIGAGASGTIYQAQHAAGQAVAVKLFKGALTSDGLPHNEMACCMVAGAHPNLIQLHGKIVAHPSQQTGLVMALIAATFSNLAAPPSLDSCTRDCYAADTVFTLEVVLKIARSIASALAHLHASGILHGDLYAHNILFEASGNSLLGDFGAASFLPVEAEKAQALQQIEVRAFGILLQELLSRCPAVAVEISAALSDLASRCTANDSAQRPLLINIINELNYKARQQNWTRF